MDYVPHDQNEVREMLQKIGVQSVNDLYKDIPADLLLDRLNLPDGLPEADLLKHLTDLSQKNIHYQNSFLGAGSYYHYIPSLVDFVISRSQFYSAYTPYQAEASQGFLQAIFEYQSAISRLTELDVTNASMYDGASALAEAATLATFHTKKNKILVIEGIHPHYEETVRTYCWGRSIEVKKIKLAEMEEYVDDSVAGVCIQSPNFFGEIEDIEEVVSRVKSRNKKALVIHCMTDPTALGILTAPGKLGVDVFVAEGQSFGLPPSFGGPSLGIFTVRNKYMRKMPGRLIGMTKELHGDKNGFILTLQAREQHIRREKALSNICSNQSLCMLAALVYLVSMGKTGLKAVASQNLQKAHYVKSGLQKIPGYKLVSTKPIYNEFVVKCPNFAKLSTLCKENGLLPPLELTKFYPDRTDQMLVCVTEENSKESIDLFLKLAKEAAQ
jgi:glycine dehydrogenase subunit 1